MRSKKYYVTFFAITVISFAAAIYAIKQSGEMVLDTDPLSIKADKLERLETYITTKYHKNIDVDTYINELWTMQEGFKPEIIIPGLREPHLDAQKKHAPLPGRLIVKIAPSEIANPFKPVATSFDKNLLINLDFLPNNIDIQNVSFVGYSRDYKVLLKFFFTREYSLSELRTSFNSTKANIYPIGLTRDMRYTNIVVSYNRTDIQDHFSNFFRPNFYHLKSDSRLHQLFRSAGVATMRRIFHSVEKKDERREGYYKVEPFKKLLNFAKENNPERTQRAYSYVYLEDIDAIKSAYQQHYGYPMNPVTNEEIIAVKDNLKPYLRRTVEVPENMENYFVLTLNPKVELPDLEATKGYISNSKLIHNISYDYPLHLATNDPLFSEQWSLENSGSFHGVGGGSVGFDIGASQAWSSAIQQRPIIVAVVDDGFKGDLNELQNRVWVNTHEQLAPTDGIDDDNNGFVDDLHGISTGLFNDDNEGLPSALYGTHGTKVAGVIAAVANNFYGISGAVGEDDVRLMNLSLGAFSPDGTPCGFAELAQAMWYAIAPSIDNNYPLNGADIVNISLSSNSHKKLGISYEIAMAALDAGVITVASAGNDGANVLELGGIYPAQSPAVIVAGGSQRDGEWWGPATPGTPGSNYGYFIDFVAPAKDIVTITFDPDNLSLTNAILTNDPLPTDPYPPSGGTSMAAAFTSGGAAVVLGRFPDISGPFMEDWLRAKAIDMTDPLGDGVDYSGDDTWTGAGMLDIGNASVSALDLNDRPIDIELVIRPIEKHVKEIPIYVPGGYFTPVAGNPAIGVRVKALQCAGCPAVINNWKLSYGVGEFPTSWTDFYSSNSDIDFETDNYGRLTNGGIFPLDTDTLAQGQLHKMRLQATNMAGTIFNDYSFFMPSRAKIRFPTKNQVIVSDRGWLPLAGHAHIQNGESYSVSVTETSSGTELWESPSYTNAYIDYPVTTGLFLLMNNKESEATFPYGLCHNGYPPMSYTTDTNMFPDTNILNNGFINYNLRVGSETDTLQLFVDDTNFSTDYWPIKNIAVHANYRPYGWQIEHLSDVPICEPNGPGTTSVTISPRDDGLDAQVFVSHFFGLSALDVNGAVVWQYFHDKDSTFCPSMSTNNVPSSAGIVQIEDINNDGISEVLTSWGILNGIDGSLRDVTADCNRCSVPYTNCPKHYNIPTSDDMFIAAAGNFSGDLKKEIIQANINSDFMNIAVADLNGLEILRRNFSIDIPLGFRSMFRNESMVRVANLDNSGFDEILVVPTGQILRADNTFQAGFDTVGDYDDADFAREGTTFNIVLSDGENIWIKRLNGSTRAGPIPGNAFKVGRESGVNDKVVIYSSNSNSLKTYDLDGNIAAGVPEIVLNGIYTGLQFHDIDDNGDNELLVLLNRSIDYFNEIPADDQIVGDFLEAYEITGGTKISDGNRWPIHIQHGYYRDSYGYFPPVWNSHISVGDVLGDSKPEFLQVLSVAPYNQELRPEFPGIRLEVVKIGN